MRKAYIYAVIAVVFALAMAGTASAKLPGQFSISANGGWMFTWGELELEYRDGLGAIGLNAGTNGMNLELGIPIKYYVPMKYGFSFYVDVNPVVIIWFPAPVAVEFGVKLGPGIEYRSGMFKAQVEGGYAYSKTTSHWFYVKGGLGLAF